MNTTELRNAAEAGTVIALAIVGLFLWVSVKDASITEGANTIGRWSWAATHMVAPTSILDLVIESIVVLFGSMSIGRRAGAVFGVAAAFALYALTSFVIAWLSAPV